MANTLSVPRSICVLTEPAVYLLLFLVLFAPQLKAQTTASWNRGTGNWSNTLDWTPNGAPNNGGGAFYNAVINGTGSDTITFDASGTIINSLSLGPGETLQDNGHSPTLTIGDPAFPVAGSLTNGGTINGGNGSTLTLDITGGNGSIKNSGVINLTSSTLKINDSGNGNTAVLSGGGTVNLTRALITGAFGDETLTNSNNIIQGSGTISNLTLVNNGTIDANALAALTITPNSGGFTNNGTANVTGLGGLVINAVAGPATNNGTMEINNSNLTVKGGLAQNPQFNIAQIGSLTLQNGSVGTITGAMSNGGVVTVNASSLTVGGDYNNILFGGPIDVSNGGTLRVLGNFNNGFAGFPGLSLSGGSSAFVAGSFTTQYDGGFTVDDSSLTILGDYRGTTGNNIASIRNGGTMTVQGGLDVGTDAGALFLSGGSSVTAGVVSNVFSTVSLSGSALTVKGDFDSAFAGWVALQGGSALTVNGTFTNGFPGELVGFGGFSNCLQGGASFLCLSGPGNVASLHAMQNNSFVSVDPGSALTITGGGFANNSGALVKLGGSLNSIGGFSNSGGTVITNPGSTLITSTYSQSGGLTDVSGTLVANSYRQSGGTTFIETGGLVSATTFNATGGTVTVNGILDPTAVEIGSHGTLQGTGIINGNVVMGGNMIAGTHGNPITFNINGNYSQNATGIFTELIGSKDNGLLNISGTAALAPGASLNIQLVGGFDPKNGTSFTIMDYGSEKGTYTIRDPYFDKGKQQWVITSYHGGDGDDVVLTAQASNVVTPEPSTMLLVGTVLLGMGGYAKKKRASGAR